MLWIRMELWAPFIIIFGGCIALSNATNGRSDEFAFPLTVIVILFYLVPFLLRQRGNIKLASPLISSKIKPKSGLKSIPVVKDKKAGNFGVSEEEKRKKNFMKR